MCLCTRVQVFLLDSCLEVEMLAQSECLFLVLVDAANCIPRGIHQSKLIPVEFKSLSP